MIIQQTPDGGIIVYNQEDFIGLVSGYGSGNYPKIGKGASHQVAINPFRNATPGVLAPGFVTTALTNAAAQVVAVIKNATVDRFSAQPNAWLIEATKIHQVAGSAGEIGKTISVTTPFPFSILGGTDSGGGGTDHSTHTTPIGQDIVFFNISGTGYIFYSYNDNIDGDVAQVPLAPTQASDFIENYLTRQGTIAAVLDKDYPHPMIVGDDQVLYIADGRTLKWLTDAGVYGSNATIVPRDYMIKCFTKTGQHLIIFAEKEKGSGAGVAARGDCIAIFWDYDSQSAEIIYQLNDNEVDGAFNWNGIIGCFTTGRPNEFATIGNRSKLQLFEGGRFVPKHYFSESIPGFGGVEIHMNMLFWNADGTIYSLGSPYQDFPQVVNKIGAGSGTTSKGYCKSLNGTDLYISTGAGASCEYLTHGANYYASSQWRGLIAEPIFQNGMQGQIEYIEIAFFGSASGGRTLTLQLDFDYGKSTSTILDAISTVTAGQQIIYKVKDSSGAYFPTVFEAIKPIVSWATGSGSSSAPIISYIKIYWKNKKITF